MPLLEERHREEIRKRLEAMKHPVKIVYFTQEFECDYCKHTRELLEELTALSDRLSLTVYDFLKDEAAAKQYGVDKIPATILLGDRDYGIRFYGIPSGYEFATLLEDILMVSQRESGLSEKSKTTLAGLKSPLHVQVFVTPVCPYCPRAVRLAHQFAMESDQIVADMVEVTEFPELGQRYNVMGVPQTVVNDQVVAQGAMPEGHFLEHVLSVLDGSHKHVHA